MALSIQQPPQPTGESPLADSGQLQRVPAWLRFLIIALLAGLIWWLCSPLGAVRAAALATALAAALLWLTETLPLPVTALLVAPALVAGGVFTPAEAFLSFGDQVVFLVLGGYALGVAVQVNRIDLWLARRVVHLAGDGSRGLLAALMLTSAGLSMLISNTATVALLLPVVGGVLAGHVGDRNLARLLLLGVAYGASIGGIATLIGSPPNAIAAGLLQMDFLDWVLAGVPVSLLSLLLAYRILLWVFPPAVSSVSTMQLPEAEALSVEARRTLIIVFLTLLLWLFGPRLAQSLGWPQATLGAASVSMLAMLMLVLARCVDWQALERGIHWGVLLLLGGGLTLGRGLTESGAAQWLAEQLGGPAGALPFAVLLLLLVMLAVFATELISNTAVTASLAPVLMGLALQIGVDAGSLVLPVAIGTSMAFMLPVATPPNAMVHATAQVTQQDMMRVGLRLNLSVIGVITLVFLLREWWG
ncbi:MAG: SLC13/DASS family transporter [Gammaproteobacteria bacterium]|nr:SLC13/DASS family transporter [Gammaproteobacteria bacterium]